MIINIEQYFGKNVTVNLIEILGCILFVIAWPLKYDISSNQNGTMITERTETDSYRFTFFGHYFDSRKLFTYLNFKY
jgi:hypothetical protein